MHTKIGYIYIYIYIYNIMYEPENQLAHTHTCFMCLLAGLLWGMMMLYGCVHVASYTMTAACVLVVMCMHVSLQGICGSWAVLCGEG